MNRPLFNRVFRQTLAWAGVAALCGVIALAQGASPAASTATPSAAAAGQRSDGQIEMDVVHALDASQALKNDLITAATIESQVTLAGTVSSQASKDLAGSIAAKVPGVTKVNNNLTIGNPQDAQNAQPADSGDAGVQQTANNPPQADGSAPPPQAYPQQAPQPYPGQAQQPYPPAYPSARPPYGYPPPQRAYNPPPAPAYRQPTGPVTIPQGTLLQVRTNEPVGTRSAKDGQPVQFTVISDVAIGGVLAIPRGATVHGVVTESKKAGDLGGSPVLALKLVSMDLGGLSYPLDSDQFKVKGPNKAGQTVGSAVGGGIIGTIIGCAVGRGVGCAVGAGAGVAAGTAASAASPGPGVWIPAEALVSFHLTTPLTVTPVDTQEAARLAQGLYPGGPSLYRRGYYPSPYGPRYVTYPYYAYPPVYYRPYYMAGGFYYWR